jgi:hypothetical protein
VLALTFVSIVAFNAGRGDLEQLIHKRLFREGKSALARFGTYTLFAGVTSVVIVLPAILAVIQELQTRINGDSGSSAKVWWLNEQCLGYGEYIMLGALTLSFSPEFDDFGFGLLWVNLFVAVAGAVYVLLRAEHAPKRVIPCYAGQGMSSNEIILHRRTKLHPLEGVSAEHVAHPPVPVVKPCRDAHDDSAHHPYCTFRVNAAQPDTMVAPIQR